jgi:hypothetical protein
VNLLEYCPFVDIRRDCWGVLVAAGGVVCEELNAGNIVPKSLEVSADELDSFRAISIIYGSYKARPTGVYLARGSLV